MTYRRDIDGLRAVAVIGVLLYHFEIKELFSGGFVGVDVFFTISGYLITGIVVGQIDAGRFDLAEFYRRRVRRIFPALFLVLAACILGSLLIEFPSEAQQTARSIVAASFFVSNIFYYRTHDYFGPDAKSDPLLHTWSLAVEEQFYIVVPLLLMALGAGRPRLRVGVLAALVLASFAASCWVLPRAAHAAFYLTPFRAWEFLVGSLLAAGALPPVRSRWTAEALGAAGFALVVGSILLLSPSVPFPGAAALAPCLGTAALIQCSSGRATVAGRILSLTPLRAVGLISYSLYLWHWPLLVFYKRIDDPSGIERVGLLALCALLATLSYRYVEQPFRRPATARWAARTLAGGLVAMAATAVAAVGLTRLHGALRPDLAVTDRLLAYVYHDLYADVRGGRCFLSEKSNDLAYFRSEECLAVRAGTPNVLILGDSHAAHLWPGLRAAHPEINWLQATASLCRPVVPAAGERRCRELLTYVLGEFLPGHRLDAILLAARWGRDDIEDVRRTAKILAQFADRVVVVGPIIEYELALPRILARAPPAEAEALASSYRKAERDDTDRRFAAAFQKPRIKYLSLRKLLCDGACVIWATSDTPLQFDYGHLTPEGSQLLASRIHSDQLRGLSE